MGANDFKIRCSAIGKIMTEAQTKSNSDKLQDVNFAIADTNSKIEACSEKAVKTRIKLEDKAVLLQRQKTELERLIAEGKDKSLSQTCKTYLNEWYVEHCYGRTKSFSSIQTEKGNAVEDDAITMLSMMDANIYSKNEQHFENEFCKGTPDIVENDLIIDIKSSFDLFTFHAAKFGDLNMDYYWQLQGYMWLVGAKRAQLAYCAISTPFSIVMKIINKARWEKGYMQDLTEDEESQIWLNHTFEDIEPERRLHRFFIDRDEEAITRIEKRVGECRAYLSEIWA